MHRHHILPKHMGGTDDEWNLTAPITIEEHAEAHRILFELHGKVQDYIAWKCLSGRITNEEARIMASKLVTAKEIVVNGITFASIADARRALGLSYNRIMLAVLEGRDPTIRRNAKPVTVNGVTYKSLKEASKETGLSTVKILAGNHDRDLRKDKLVCPHCGKTGDRLNMNRWHFDNCKHKETK